MSGVYIKNMDMPSVCDECWALDDGGDYPRCRITNEQRGYTFRVREKRMDRCPLMPVPDHGDLIDADALIINMMDRGVEGIQTDDFYEITQIIDEAPTIIPADKDGAE